MEAEEAVRVVRSLDPPQTVVVGPVIGVRPVLEVGVWEVRIHTPGSPWMYQRPRPRHPVAGGGALGRSGVGGDLDQVLDQEAFAAVGEGGRVGAHAVVGGPPRQEVDLPRLAGGQPLDEVLDQRRDCVGRQWSAEELRLGVEVARLQWPLWT